MFPRHGHVLAGALRAINPEARKADTDSTGDFIIEAVWNWRCPDHADTLVGCEIASWI